MQQPLAYDAVVELSASINPDLVTDVMSASRLVNRGYVVHCDLMPVIPLSWPSGIDVFPNRSSICLIVLAYCSGLRLVAHQAERPEPSKRDVVKTLALGNVASAMMHVQRQR